MWSVLRQRALVQVVKNARQSSGLSQEQIEKTRTLMQRLSMFGVPVVVALAGVNAYYLEEEHKSHPRKEYVAYPYLNMISKTWPWGNGKHSLFHNPKTNYIKGEGFEEEWYTPSH